MTSQILNQAVLEYIVQYRAKHSFSPSYRQICEGVGVSLGSVADAVKSLEKQKALKVTVGAARSVVPLKLTIIQGGKS